MAASKVPFVELFILKKERTCKALVGIAYIVGYEM